MSMNTIVTDIWRDIVSEPRDLSSFRGCAVKGVRIFPSSRSTVEGADEIAWLVLELPDFP